MAGIMKPSAAFRIRFLDEEVKARFGEATLCGEIGIGRFSERFHAPIEYWTVDDYRNQWSAAKRMLQNGEAPVVFAVAVRPREQLNSFIEFWIVYRRGDDACIQNKAYLCAKLPIGFEEDQHHFQALCGERTTQSSTGHAVSEWVVPWDSVVMSAGIEI